MFSDGICGIADSWWLILRVGGVWRSVLGSLQSWFLVSKVSVDSLEAILRSVDLFWFSEEPFKFSAVSYSKGAELFSNPWEVWEPLSASLLTFAFIMNLNRFPITSVPQPCCNAIRSSKAKKFNTWKHSTCQFTT